MREHKRCAPRVLLCLYGALVVVWVALRTAPHWEGGLLEVVMQWTDCLAHPFRITWCAHSPRVVALGLGIYGLVLMCCLNSGRNYRKGEEYGSACWGSPRKLGKAYAAKVATDNIILTQHVSIGLQVRQHRRNLNVVVIGGSGSGKTRFYVKVNIMNANTSFVCLDPKGELLRDTGHLMKERGYEIKVLDLINMEKSHCYNPFVYIRGDNDVQRLVTNLFKNTTPKGTQSSDPFWDSAAMMLLMALMLYLYYEAPPEEQNFPMVLEMIRAGEVKEDNDDYCSLLDELFERLAMRNPQHIALKFYRSYRSGSAKTLKSIQITLLARLEKFNLDSLAGISQCDELELDQMGERKSILYAVIPDSDSSFNFVVGLLYTQLFQQLYYQADVVHGGTLPVHVHFAMDEFANCALPDDFDKLLATMRSQGSAFPSFCRVRPNSRRCTKSNGRASWGIVTSSCIWGEARRPAMSMSPNCWGRRRWM